VGGELGLPEEIQYRGGDPPRNRVVYDVSSKPPATSGGSRPGKRCHVGGHRLVVSGVALY
jgi:hypothetical protein